MRDKAGLAAMDNGRRLSVLARIETVLAADGLTWDDLAMQMMPPAYRPVGLVTMVNIICRWGGSQTDYTNEFFSDLKWQGQHAKGNVYLTERQSRWLWDLYRQALDRRTQAQQQHADVQGGVSNVVYLRAVR